MNGGEIDLEFSNFVYELAANVGRFPATASLALGAADEQVPLSEREASDDIPGEWTVRDKFGS